MAKPVTLSNIPEVRLLEDITRESAARVIEQLSAYKGKTVALSIFSDGGDVFGANALASWIANPANGMDVEARVYGNAASGAMVIAASCQRAYISEGSFSLIHMAYAAKDGERVQEADLSEEDKTTLAAMNEAQVDLFKRRTGKTRAQVEKMLEDGKPITADEAVNAGLFDGKIAQAKMAALFKTEPMSDKKYTAKGRMLTAIALKGNEVEIELDAPAPTPETVDAVAAKDAEIADLKAKLATAETEKATLETAKVAEVAAKTTAEASLVTMTTERDQFKAAVEKLKTLPLVAQLLADGNEAVIPGVKSEEKPQPEMSDRAKHAKTAHDIWMEAKKRNTQAYA